MDIIWDKLSRNSVNIDKDTPCDVDIVREAVRRTIEDFKLIDIKEYEHKPVQNCRMKVMLGKLFLNKVLKIIID